MAERAPTYPVDLDLETPTERETRLAWERERIAEAEEDLKVGRYIEGEEALDWLDRWAAGEDLEEPKLA